MSSVSAADQPDSQADAIPELQRMGQELEQVRQKLRFTEQLLAAVFDQASYPIAVMDVHPDGHFVTVKGNPPMLRMLGLSATSSSITDENNQNFNPEVVAMIRSRLQAALQAGTTLSFEGQLQMQDRTVWTQALYTPIPGADPAHRWVSVVAFDVTAQKLREQEGLAHREQIIEQQALSLNELSTPLLAINDRVVVLPLIGAIDSHRAQLIIETLLNGIAEARAQIVIIDITGVSVVDTQIANAIIQAAQAARLLGAHVVLTGIRPEIAQVIVSLGIDLGDIVTRSTLQAGITYAVQQ